MTVETRETMYECVAFLWVYECRDVYIQMYKAQMNECVNVGMYEYMRDKSINVNVWMHECVWM